MYKCVECLKGGKFVCFIGPTKAGKLSASEGLRLPDQGLCRWTGAALEAPPPDPRYYTLALRARHPSSVAINKTLPLHQPSY